MGHGKPGTYVVTADRLQKARDMAMEAAAVLHEAVTKHDPAERVLLEELQALHIEHAKAHRFEAQQHERTAERIGRLLRADDRENVGHADGLTSLRLLTGLLDMAENEPAVCA